MTDSMKDRRKRDNPTKKQVEASRLAGVSREELAETITNKRRWRSSKSIRSAIDRASRRKGGFYASRVDKEAKPK